MIFKLSHTHSIFFTSDTHFSHAKSIEFSKRPFSSAQEMDEMLIVNWNSVVPHDGIVIHLGDFSLAATAVERFVKRLNGYKILVAGNHDFVHPAHRRSKTKENHLKWVIEYMKHGWSEVHHFLNLELPDGTIIKMNHLPYLED